MNDPSNPRKSALGKIEIKMRLRVPLLKADVVSLNQKWLEVSFGSDTKLPSAVKERLPEPRQDAKQTKHEVAVAPAKQEVKTSKLEVIAKKITEPAPSTAPAEKDVDIDDLEHKFLMYDLYDI